MIVKYIDPGTGSMLFTILIGVLSAGVYAARNAIVNARFLLSGGREKGSDETHSIVILSESRRYWNVFEPICDEFERRGKPLLFYTGSPDDPALKKTYEHVKCEFIGEENRGFAKMNLLKADIVLATTPELDVYQWKRSRDVKWYAHITHAVGDITLYRMFGTDYYDALLLNGALLADQARKLEEARGLPAKELILTGSTYMDNLTCQIGASENRHVRGDIPTVLLAPSWGESSIFNLYGGSIIEKLLDTGYHIIVRPHPQSFVSEADLISQIMSDFPSSDQLEWNRDNNNFEVLERSDILISDYSSVVFDFALGFDRPIIYTEPNLDLAPYDACWLDETTWTLTRLPMIGQKLEIDEQDLKELIDDCLENPRFQQGRDRVRSECWCHPGEAASRVVDYLLEKSRALQAGPN